MEARSGRRMGRGKTSAPPQVRCGPRPLFAATCGAALCKALCPVAVSSGPICTYWNAVRIWARRHEHRSFCAVSGRAYFHFFVFRWQNTERGVIVPAPVVSGPPTQPSSAFESSRRALLRAPRVQRASAPFVLCALLCMSDVAASSLFTFAGFVFCPRKYRLASRVGSY
jgi:hypothetical protein